MTNHPTTNRAADRATDRATDLGCSEPRSVLFVINAEPRKHRPRGAEAGGANLCAKSPISNVTL